MDVRFSAARFVEASDCLGCEDAHGYVLRDDGFVGGRCLQSYAVAAICGIEDVVVVRATAETMILRTWMVVVVRG